MGRGTEEREERSNDDRLFRHRLRRKLEVIKSSLGPSINDVRAEMGEGENQNMAIVLISYVIGAVTRREGG